MGSNQSSTVKQTTEILNKSVTNIVNNNKLLVSASNTNTNNFEVRNGRYGKIKNCSLKIGQKIEASQQIKAMNKISSVNDMKTMLKAAVDNATSQNNSATNGFLVTAFNNQKSNTEINNILKNEIENNITNDNLTQCNGVIDNINNGVFINEGEWDCGTDGPIVIDQRTVSAQLVECFAHAAQEAMMQNQNIADAVNKSTQENTSKNAGASELVGTIMGPYAMIIVGVILVIGIIAYFILRGGSSSDETQYAQPQYPQYAQHQYPQYPQYAQHQYPQYPQYQQYPPAGRVRGSSYSPLIKKDIDPKYIFIFILLAIIYFSKNKENYAEEKVYNF